MNAAQRGRPGRVRVSAIGVSIVLHVVAIAAGAWIESGATARQFALDRPGESRYEARVVARQDPVDVAVAPAPPVLRRDEIPSSTAKYDDPVAALNLDEADDVAPPAAAPSIAVEGGSAGHARPREWSDHPTISRSVFAGVGHGGRREGGHGRGRVAPAIQAEQAPPPATAIVQAPPPPPSVRVEARIVSFAPPTYPESARSRNLEGLVRIEVDVLESGSIAEIRVVESSGVQAFDDAAVKAVRKWRFAPATIDGVAVRSTIVPPPIRFRLE